MKPIKLLCSAVALAGAVTLSPVALAQTTVTTTRDTGPAVVTTREAGSTAVTTTTTRVGRVGTVTPDTLMMDAAAGTEPVPYVRTARTVFVVDETGATVPVETVRAGSPVTIHYTRDADRYMADRVVVHRQTTVKPEPTVVERSTVVEKPVKPPVIIRKEATTTTTTTEPVKIKKDKDEDDD